MRYIITLTNVHRADSESLGFRATDLAILKEKGFNVPLSFVINTDAFEDFLSANGLRAKTERVILEKPDPSDAYQEIMNLFVKSKIPKELETELLEAYDSLAIDTGTGASGLISGHAAPFVMLVQSPSYLLPTDAEEGILQNLKGPDQFIVGLKLIWSSAFSPESRQYRAEHGLSEKFGMAVLAEKMKQASASAVAYSRTDYNEFMIRVKSYKGFLDYGEPIAGKDVHEVDVNSLLIRKSELNNQEYLLARAVESEELVKRQLLDDGAKQKINDKMISECARIAKRAKSFIGKDVKVYLSIQSEVITVMQVNRMIITPAKEVQETETVTVQEDESGRKEVQVEQERVVREEPPAKLEMPSILSSEEAKKSVLNEHAHKLFSLNGFSEDVSATKPAEAVAEDIPKNIPKIIPEPVPEQVFANEAVFETSKAVAKEENLLDIVMEIKEHIEKMENHAASGNKEAYEQEGRHIKNLLKHIKEE